MPCKKCNGGLFDCSEIKPEDEICLCDCHAERHGDRYTGQVITGRPDFRDHRFGETIAKRHAEYVYSKLGGQLAHKIRQVRLRWWVSHWDRMLRLVTPHVLIDTVCGLTFTGKNSDGKQRAAICVLPKEGAVLCGRCHGTGSVFGDKAGVVLTYGQLEPNPPLTVTRKEAKARIGCTVEVD